MAKKEFGLGNMADGMDAYLDGALRQIGRRLIIYKIDYGKTKWRVCIAPGRR